MPLDEDSLRYVNNAAVANLTATSGSTDDTIADVGGTYNQTVLNNNFRDLAAKVNAILAALRANGIIELD